MLAHPDVGGVILFARNYASPEQVSRLTTDIHAVRTPPLLIAVDHEGGRVQRFREGFTRLPAMRDLGVLHDHSPVAARDLARNVGSVLAHELRACGVDFSFAPVLDLDYGRSGVIGDRAFHTDPEAVAELAAALVAGLADGGMGAVGKHFPGHGFAEADSHTAMPVDERSLEEIERQDLEPFRRLVAAGLEGIMPAHVLYPRIDPQPAGYSRFWLQTMLRERLRFRRDHLQRRPLHGRRARCRQHRRTRLAGPRRRLRRGARVQRSCSGGDAAGWTAARVRARSAGHGWPACTVSRDPGASRRCVRRRPTLPRSMP